METTRQQTSEERSAFRGTVVSVAMAQTVTVAVDTYKTYPKYRKKYRSTKRYLVHLPEGAKVPELGDKVSFRECRPISKRKHHILVSAD